MRRRSREVNIFNMSLLDILCGALGAFCFMMIALLPYWRPAGQTAGEIQKQHEQAMEELSQIESEINKLTGKDGNLADKLEKLRSKLKNIESSRQQEQAEKRKLQEKADRADELDSREPLTVSMRQDSADHDVDLYVRLLSNGANGKPMPAPDPNTKQQVFFTKDANSNCISGPCSELWTSVNTGAGKVMEIYFKFLNANGNPAPASVSNIYYLLGTEFQALPRVAIPQEKTVVKLGEIHFQGGSVSQFKPEPQYVEAFNTLKKPAAAENKTEEKKQ